MNKYVEANRITEERYKRRYIRYTAILIGLTALVVAAINYRDNFKILMIYNGVLLICLRISRVSMYKDVRDLKVVNKNTLRKYKISLRHNTILLMMLFCLWPFELEYHQDKFFNNIGVMFVIKVLAIVIWLAISRKYLGVVVEVNEEIAIYKKKTIERKVATFEEEITKF